jgi:CMP-N,N'-diacetyllegionaminic acid synthase
MKNLAIITARSGSKRLPDKNIRELKGLPMIAYTIRAAQQSLMFDQIIVSTDSKAYAEIAVQYGAWVPFLRSKKNSRDLASSWDVLREVIKELKQRGYYYEYETIALLQPTSPLRTATDIIGAYELFKEKNADIVVSVAIEDKAHLLHELRTDYSLESIFKPNLDLKSKEIYVINGAIYIVQMSLLSSINSLENQKIFAYLMPKSRSIDVDNEFDFLLANFMAGSDET